MQRYEFTSTTNDLLDAEEADITERTGLRRLLRYTISALATIWAASGLFALGLGRHGWIPLIWFIAGVLVAYHLVGRSYLSKRRIRLSGTCSTGVIVEFHVDYIQVEIASSGIYQRKWNELLGFRDATQGILLYFSDGTVNWLPSRIFANKADREATIDLLRAKSAVS